MAFSDSDPAQDAEDNVPAGMPWLPLAAIEARAGRWDFARAGIDAGHRAGFSRGLAVAWLASQLQQDAAAVQSHLGMPTNGVAVVEKQPDPADGFKPFPTHVLPEPLQSYVRMVSAATSVDESAIALLLLPVLASCIGTTRRAYIKGGWTESCALWSMFVCRPSAMKSVAYNEVIGLLSRINNQAQEDYERDCIVYRREEEARKNRTRQKLYGDDEPLVEPTKRELVAQDITREAVINSLRNNHRGMLIPRDELRGWLNGFGAYKNGRGGDEQFWLEMYGQSLQMVTRKGGTLENRHMYVKRALISVMGGIQPGALKRAIGPEQIDEGMASRFMLTWPPEGSGEWTEAEIDPKCRAAMLAMVELVHKTVVAGEDGEPVDMPLTADAKVLWINHVNALAGRTRAEKSDALRAAHGKLKGTAGRIALVLQVCRAAVGEAVSRDMLEVEQVRAGIEIAWWLLHEAERIYRLMGWTTAAVVTAAPQPLDERLLALLRQAPAGLTLTEIHSATGRKLNGKQVRAILDDLVDRGAARVCGETVSTGNGHKITRWAAVPDPV